ncbi:MAG: hypothetical protein WCD53_12605 [Microcoleus sp.]
MGDKYTGVKDPKDESLACVSQLSASMKTPQSAIALFVRKCDRSYTMSNPKGRSLIFQ